MKCPSATVVYSISTIRTDRRGLEEKIKGLKKKIKASCGKEGIYQLETKIFTRRDLVLVCFIKTAEVRHHKQQTLRVTLILEFVISRTGLTHKTVLKKVRTANGF